MSTKSAKPKKPNGEHASNDRVIPFDEAVAECRKATTEFVGQERYYWTYVAERADRIEPKYGDRTLAKFAKEIGVADCVLKRHLSVYRAWDGKGIEAPGPTSYAVMREFQNHHEARRTRQGEPDDNETRSGKPAREHEGKPRKDILQTRRIRRELLLAKPLLVDFCEPNFCVALK